MASAVITLRAKDDTRAAAQSAAGGLQQLGNTVKNVQKLFAGFLALKAIQGIGKLVSGTTEAFQVQQRALASLSQAVSNNVNLTAEAGRRLIGVTSKLQSTSIYGDEMLQQQVAFLANMGLTETQIEQTLTAATELSSAGIGNLESNVRNLSKTFNGTAGELAALIPGMRDLTAEQLASGEAIRLINEQYKGFNESLANTLEGRTTQVSNLMGDIKERIGAIFGALKFDGFANLIPILQSIEKWLTDNQEKIINFVINIPDIFSAALRTVWSMIQTIFTLDFWVEYLSAVATLWTTVFRSTFNAIGAVLQALGLTIWEPLRWGFESMAYNIRSVFNTVVNALVSGIEAVLNFLQGGVNLLIRGINGIRSILPGRQEEIAELQRVEMSRRDTSVGERPAGIDTAAIANAWRGAGSTLGVELKAVVGAVGDFATDFGSLFSDSIAQAGLEFGEILNRDLPPEIRALLDPLSTIANNTEAGQTGEEIEGPVVPVPAAGGDLSFLGGLFEALGPVIGQFMSMLGALQSVQAILDPVSVILQGVFDVIAPVIDSLLKPLIGILFILGQTIGAMLVPVLRMLEPVIMLISQAFVFLYNYAIRPFANFIIDIIVTVGNFFIGVIRGVIGLLNKIPGVNIAKPGYMDAQTMHLQEIDNSNLTAAGSQAGGGSGGSGASYAAAKDVTINISFEHSYVNGDSRLIALMLRDEIAAAESLGL